MLVAKPASGLSLVELLLAMALGLVVTLGLVQQYSGGLAAAAQVRDRSALQDAGAYALGFLRRSAAAAGHFGCNSSGVRLRSGLNGAWTELFEFDLTQPVQGFDYQGDGQSTDLAAWSPTLADLPREGAGGTLNALAAGAGIRIDRLAPGADVIVFRRLQAPAHPLAARVGADDDPVVLNVDGSELDAGDVALISDCRQATLFRVTGLVPAGQRLTLLRVPGGGIFGNAGGGLPLPAGRPYGGEAGPQGAVVGRVLTEIYFVAVGAGPGVLSLWRRSGSDASAELVEGVVDLQVLVGVDRDLNDGLDGVNRYVGFNELRPEHRIRSLELTVTARQNGTQRRFTQVVAMRNA